ncbi:M4 family metallopeptidase [Tenggerimyces flavus]|uniref:M4 family metallopeptidase n=1 Tax=Tenggerimyces flavus TaxID=1708749 RepID=A0ABV7YHG4_9ACTN|nr:M4 family metallopeptidase [Tenggerimyces flavus]MBM7784093.1 Zn-dependent metalloprotease [Tenggerimyces flavus]
MKYRRTVGGIAALATVASASALVAFSSPSYAGSTTDLSFLDQTVRGLEKTTDNTVEKLLGSNGDVSVIKAKGAPIALPKGAPASPTAEQAAKIQLDAHGKPFGVSTKDVKIISTAKVGDGDVVKFQQYKNDLPVFAGEVVASMDKKGGLEALLGGTVKGAVDSVQNVVPNLQSARTAKEYVAKRADVSKALLLTESKGKWIYNPSTLGAPGPSVNRVVNRYDVKSVDGLVDWTVLVDRGFGIVALGYSNHHYAVNRKVCNNANKANADLEQNVCDGKTLKYVRSEGQAAVGDEEVDDIYDQLGNTAKWYAQYGGTDLTALVGTGTDGKALRATARICATNQQPECPMQNAFWGSGQMYFGEGFDLLDITGHEVTHGVTEKTSALRYAYQAGAINESMSDVFGEYIDLATNPSKVGTDRAWILGDDDANLGFFRDMEDPTKSSDPQPDKMTSNQWFNDAEFRDFGGVHANSGVGNKAGFLLGSEGTTKFNGYDVRGLGLKKAWKVYWATQNVLTSGSDYKDLFYTLPVACRKLVGKSGTQVTADDCRQVDNAVRATEMYKNAASAAPVATPYCGNKAKVAASTSQGFDGPKKPSDWNFEKAALLSNAEAEVDYANRGADSALLFTQVAGGGAPEVTSATLSSDPKGVPSKSLLRFDYVAYFGWAAIDNVTSARLEYRVGGGAWKAASGLAGAVNPGPWKGHSFGWSSAKYPLDSLAGKQVAWRFVMTKAPSDAAQIATLNVDNFKIYTCK